MGQAFPTPHHCKLSALLPKIICLVAGPSTGFLLEMPNHWLAGKKLQGNKRPIASKTERRPNTEQAKKEEVLLVNLREGASWVVSPCGRPRTSIGVAVAAVLMQRELGFRPSLATSSLRE